MAARRRRLRVLVVLMALLGANCLEDAVGPPVIGYFALTPAFESQAAGIVPVTEVRVTIAPQSDSSMGLDTVVAIAPEDTVVDLTFEVVVLEQNALFNIGLDVRDATGAVVFQGRAVAQAVVSVDQAQPLPIAIRYTGVGFDAERVEIVTPDTSGPFDGTLQFVAEALDSSGVPIPGTPIVWESLDTTRVLIPDRTSGTVVLRTTRGPASISATLLTNQADTASVDVLPVPNRIVIQDGDGQTGFAGSLLGQPLRARVLAVDNGGVANVLVRFQTSPGTVDPDSAFTNANGIALTQWTLGGIVATQTVAAFIRGVTDSVVTFNATAIPGQVDTVIVTPDNAQFSALGETIQLVAAANDSLGNQTGVTVGWSSDATPVAIVDQSGLVTAVGNGTATITASAAGATASAVIDVAQVVDSVAVSPSIDTVRTLNATMQFSATAFDANDSVVTGARLIWTSSDQKVAVIDSMGTAMSRGEGSSTITGMANGVPGFAGLVVQVAVADVQIVPDSVSMLEADTVRLRAAVTDSAGTDLQRTVAWASSDPSVAAVNVNGLVTAIGLGGATVTATLGSVADTIPVLVTRPGLLQEAIDSLEAALFVAINNLDTLDEFDPNVLDKFSFNASKTLFQQALAVDPGSQTAAFGLAASMVLSLIHDPEIRNLMEEWDDWLTVHDDDIGDITQGNDFPPTLARHQLILETRVEPVIMAAQQTLSAVDSVEFVFPLTPGMQGDTVGGERDTLELDYTEILAFRMALEASLAGIDVALAYRTDPSPYGPAGFSAALAPGSTFGTLAPNGAARLADAHARLLNAINIAQQGLDVLEAETDDQSNDVLKYSSGASCCWDLGRILEDSLNAQDLLDARDALADMEGALMGPYTINEDLGFGVVPLVVDASVPFLNPIVDLKQLIPAYLAQNGEFNWTAFIYADWLIPDPTFTGFLPGMPSSDSLKKTVELDDVFEGARFDIDEWVVLTSAAADSDLHVMTRRGNAYEVAGDFSNEADRPDMPVDTSFGYPNNPPVALLSNQVSGDIVALTADGRLFSRPDDGATGWTEQLQLTSSFGPTTWVGLATDPVSGTMYAAADFGEVVRISSSYLITAVDSTLAFISPSGMVFQPTTGDLIAQAQCSGDIYSRAPGTTDWTFRASLGTFSCDPILTIDPVTGRLFRIDDFDNFTELSADLTVVTDLPDIGLSGPLTLFDETAVALHYNVRTSQLVAITRDGRIFYRPDDGSSPWVAVAIVLPRVIVP